MGCFCIKDRISQEHFLIYWDKGLHNLADYFTKHLSPTYHKKIRSTYILKGYNLSLDLIPGETCIQGCVDPLPGLRLDTDLP